MYINWNYSFLLRTVGVILNYSSFTFLVPFLLSLFYKESFLISLIYLFIFLVLFSVSYVLKKVSDEKIENLLDCSFVHFLLVVCIVWLVYAVFAALPFVLVGGHSFIDGYFETISALTTTGHTIFTALPLQNSLILWRSFLSWIGGIGIIILVYFGLSGAFVSSGKLFTAEGHDRLRPSYKNTVKHIWYIYLIFTIIGVLLLFIFGMNLFNAVNYSMVALSTTGFNSTVNFEYYLSNIYIQLSLIFIMLIGATSFIVHYRVFTSRSLKQLDKQFMFLLVFILVFFILIFLKIGSTYNWSTILLNVVSLITGGGITSFSPSIILGLGPFIFLVFMLIMLTGSSTNSTAGGLKIDRVVLFFKSLYWKIKEIILPDIVNIPKKYNNQIINDSQIKEIYFFILMYVLFICLGVFVLTIYNFPITESFFEVISAQSNVGISVGIVSPTMPIVAKIMLILNMWVGRLEIIPILGLIGMIIQRRKRWF